MAMTECRASLFTGSIQAKHQAAGVPKVWARDAHTLEPQMTQMSADTGNRNANLRQSESSAVKYTADRLEFPTFHDWNKDYFPKVRGTEVEVHHVVEKYVQKLIGVNTELVVANGARLKNTCPGIPLPRKKDILDDINAGQLPQHQLKAIHRGPQIEGGISPIMQSVIPTGRPASTTALRQGIIDDLREIYDDYDDLANQWPVARDWLKKLRDNDPSLFKDPNLNIPD